MTDRPDPVGELEALARDQRKRIRELEAAELRLREQDPTYADRRVAEERRLLFQMLVALAELGGGAGPADAGEEGLGASEEAARGFNRLVEAKRAEILMRLRPDVRSVDPARDPAEVEADWTRALGEPRRADRGGQ
jgi:hypothetical protein